MGVRVLWAGVTLAAVTACSSLQAVDSGDDVAAFEWNAEAWRSELLSWRDSREQRLRSPEGYLAISHLLWLEPGRNSVGSGADSALKLGGDDVPHRLGDLVLEGDAVSFELSPGESVRFDDETSPAAGRRELASDTSGAPTRVHVGQRVFWVIERAGRLGIRVRDPQSPVLASFAGTDWFDPQEVWRVDARFVPHAEPKAVDVPNILGSAYDDVTPGVLLFEIDGRQLVLHPTGSGPESLALIFGDASNGDGSYGGGRFLSLPAPDEEGRLVLDFNRAYNPPCAFSPFTTCPLPPASNRLDIAIPAGERSPPEHH